MRVACVASNVFHKSELKGIARLLNLFPGNRMKNGELPAFFEKNISALPWFLKGNDLPLLKL
jgi:hypothetical protein